MINLQNVKVKNGSTWNTICPFPVGFVYSSYTNTSPGSTFGGTWTPITGRFPYYNNGVGTGGSNSHNHIYGIGGRDYWSLQSALQIYNGSSNTWTTINTRINNENGTVNNSAVNDSKTVAMAWYHATANTTSTSNMPQYQTLYAWRRTA